MGNGRCEMMGYSLEEVRTRGSLRTEIPKIQQAGNYKPVFVEV